MSLSQNELIQAGYGLRPDTASPLYSKWLAAVSKPLTIVAPISMPEPGLSHLGSPTYVSSTNWCGTALNVTNGLGGYWAALGAFTVPTFGAQGSNYAAGMWPGSGGWYDNKLMQDGIEYHRVSGVTKYESWWQYVPDQTLSQVTPSVVPHPGDSMLFESWECDASGHFGYPYHGYACFYYIDKHYKYRVLQGISAEIVIISPERAATPSWNVSHPSILQAGAAWPPWSSDATTSLGAGITRTAIHACRSP